MPATTNISVYQNVVSITADYLGPAAPRFIERQVINHLNKAPDKLSTEDLKVLLKWCRASLSLITNDKKIIEEFSERIALLELNESTR